jgi:hypothetical protein
VIVDDPDGPLRIVHTFGRPSLSSPLTRLVGGDAHITLPSGPPVMPSAFSNVTAAISHFASAAITPGIAVTVTGRS